MLKLAILACIILGIDFWVYIGIPIPAWYLWLRENKVYGCMMIFFVSNAIEGQLMSTGAFEIQFNDVPIWSKLETGRIPQPHELFQIIDNHVRLQHNQNAWHDAI